ncbi:MAG: regulatory iron-sulfur-containing complex subunit RicT [Planctomycetales bacterium]
MSQKYVVRYGLSRHLGEFLFKGSNPIERNTNVIIRTDRGVEWGEVLCAATDRTREYLGLQSDGGNILRESNMDDFLARDQIWRKERDEFNGCKQLIAEHKLQMQLVDVEHLFGEERLVFYYLSENRIDFRELVKALARQFHTRIEMRQIGVRDEAKLLADYGDCGKPVCCNTHLREMPPVSMKMAKLQKATLDPVKISGRCGRLKCCLRYEHDTYEEYRRELPPVGALVLTKVGQGKVVGLEILARKMVVQYEDKRQVLTEERDILTIVSRGKKKPSDDEDLPAPEEN